MDICKLDSPAKVTDSSQNTTQTQEINSQFSDFLSQEESPIIWGKLSPVQNLIGESIFPSTIYLSNDEYMFGRHASCDIQFPLDKFPPNQRSKFNSTHVSNRHFRIYRVKYYGPNNVEGNVIYLENEGQNGTIVNNVCIHKGEKIILLHGDLISISFYKVKLFEFICPYDPSFLIPEIKNKYAIFESIGSGTYGDVRICFSRDGSEKFAIKIAKKAKLNVSKNKNSEKYILNEIEICKKANHQFILKLKECIVTSTLILLVLELMEGGDLTERINKTKGLTENVAKLIFYQITSAVRYLHENGIAHRDLKPCNILLATNDEETLVKVADFGLSKYVDSDLSCLKTFCGTPLYVAPEILLANEEGAYTKQVDVWSLGVILYVCLSGKIPFIISDKFSELKNQIVNGMYDFGPKKFKNISFYAKDLIKQMMTVQPCKRITASKILMHPWLNDHNIQLKINSLLENY